jgi:hypothetical protein
VEDVIGHLRIESSLAFLLVRLGFRRNESVLARALVLCVEPVGEVDPSNAAICEDADSDCLNA